MLSSLICLVGGVGDLVGGGDCWEAGVAGPFKIPEHFACTHP